MWSASLSTWKTTPDNIVTQLKFSPHWLLSVWTSEACVYMWTGRSSSTWPLDLNMTSWPQKEGKLSHTKTLHISVGVFVWTFTFEEAMPGGGRPGVTPVHVLVIWQGRSPRYRRLTLTARLHEQNNRAQTRTRLKSESNWYSLGRKEMVVGISSDIVAFKTRCQTESWADGLGCNRTWSSAVVVPTRMRLRSLVLPLEGDGAPLEVRGGRA